VTKGFFISYKQTTNLHKSYRVNSTTYTVLHFKPITEITMANRFGMEYNTGDDVGFSSPDANVNYPSPSSGGNPRRKATDEQTLIPVTVGMLVNAAQNNKLLLDERETHHIKVVAAVTSVQMGSTSYSYTVEDGTGTIDVKEWLDEGNIEVSRMREEAAVEHQYVRIMGKLEEYDGKPQIVAHTVRKLPNGNELTYHFLEVVYEGEKYKQSQQIVGSPTYAMGNMNFGGNIPIQSSRPIVNDGQGNGGGMVDEIKSFLAGSSDDVGGDMLEFIKRNKNKYNEYEIRQKFEMLATEGIIYSTVDENHFSIII